MRYNEIQYIDNKIIAVTACLILFVHAIVAIVVNDMQGTILLACITAIIIGLIIVFHRRFSLTVNITAAGIECDIKGGIVQKISRADIESIEIKQLQALKQFGGWGIRYNTATKTKGYIFGGKHYLLLHYGKGQKLAVSIKHPAAAKEQLQLLQYPVH